MQRAFTIRALNRDSAAAHLVRDLETGATLDGAPSPELVVRSIASDASGAVNAYRDDAGIWQYVAPRDVQFHCEILRLAVITVYVEVGS